MIKRLMPLLVLGLAAGCSSKDRDLERFIEQVKQEQPEGVEPLPEVKLPERYYYTAQSWRSPFVPGNAGGSDGGGVRPNIKRNREYLEQFALDTLRMKGTLNIGGRNYGLVQATDGRIYRVLPGNYVGQNDGRITAIEASKISITEIIPDQLGGFIERGAQLTLDE